MSDKKDLYLVLPDGTRHKIIPATIQFDPPEEFVYRGVIDGKHVFESFLHHIKIGMGCFDDEKMKAGITIGDKFKYIPAWKSKDFGAKLISSKVYKD